jgi:outer membrane protein OmpA-like peptidoglycan-associated protein
MRVVILTVCMFFLFLGALFSSSGCTNPQPGPDKTIAGAVLGAAWGAGAGAVVGNQIMHDGEGVAVGAGLGLVQGSLQGAGFDINESALEKQQEELEAIQVANAANRHRLTDIQTDLDTKSFSSFIGGVYQVFFDIDSTSMRAGAVSNLDVIANSILQSPRPITVQVVGHSDDSGTPDYNSRLSESRARNVAAYLSGKGFPSSQIEVSSFGSQRPIASNETPVGRQLNRRVDVYVSDKDQ